MTIGPVSSGSDAASIIAAQPPWQLPMMAGLALSGAAARTFLTKTCSACADVEQGLAGLRIAKEDDEVDRVPGAQRHAHLRVVLEAADARPVAGARVDDDVGPLARIDRDARGRRDAQQRVVDRLSKLRPSSTVS